MNIQGGDNHEKALIIAIVSLLVIAVIGVKLVEASLPEDPNNPGVKMTIMAVCGQNSFGGK